MRWRMVLAVLMLVGLAGVAGGQWGGGAVGYDPEIGTVQDGIVHDVRATVSADRRYVQLDFRSGMAVIERIDDFEVVTW